MFVLGVDHVQIAAPAGCEREARQFFGEVVGLAEIEKPLVLQARGGVWFQAGAQQLHVGVDPAFAPARKAHPAFKVAPELLDALADRLAQSGTGVTWDADLPNSRRFFCGDPWGNRLEFLAEKPA